MNLAREVAKNTIYKSSGTLISSISGLLFTIVIARVLKPEHFGIYSLTMSIVFLASVLADLGIGSATVRYIAYHVGKGDFKKIRGHFKYFLKIKLYLSSGLFILLYFGSPIMAKFFHSEILEVPFKISAFILVGYSISTFLINFFIGLSKFKYLLIWQSTYEAGRWIFAIPLAILFLSTGVLIGFFLAYLLSFIVILFYAIKRYKPYIFGVSSKIDVMVNIFIGFSAITSITSIIYIYVDNIMIGYFLDTTQVGFYRAGYNIIMATSMLISLAPVLYPVFTQMSNKDLQNAVNRITKYTSMIAFPVYVILAFLSREIIRAVYGMEYTSASYPMMILSILVITFSFYFLIDIFNAKEVPEYPTYVTIISMILNIILNYILIPKIGIAGAAYATVISRVFAIISVSYLLYKMLNITLPIIIIGKTAVATFMMCIVLLFLVPKPRTLMVGLFEAFSAIIVYIIVLISIGGLNKSDLIFLRSFIK